MAAPNYRNRPWYGRNVVAPERPEPVPGHDAGRELRKKRARERNLRRKDAGRRRRFVFVVLVPVALMLVSVYLHTVASGIDDKTTKLTEAISTAESKQEALEVRESELSDSERIRSIAREDLGMRDPVSKDFASRPASVVDGNNGDIGQRQGEVR